MREDVRTWDDWGAKAEAMAMMARSGKRERIIVDIEWV